MYPWAVSRAAVDWHAVGAAGAPMCFLRFGPDIREMDDESPAHAGQAHPAIESAAHALADSIVRAVDAAGLVRVAAARPLAETVEHCVGHALAQIAVSSTLVEAWSPRPRAESTPLVSKYPGCPVARLWPAGDR
jgi:hypothetical protein